MTNKAMPERTPELSPTQQLVVDVAMLLDELDLDLLQRCAGETLQPLVDELRGWGWLQPADQGYRFDSTIRSQWWEMLQASPERLQAAYASLVAAWASRLEHAPAPSTASQYINSLQAWCELLIRQAPDSLADAIATVPIDRLPEPGQRHLVRYYQGLGAGLAERWGAARERFASLLAAPDLAPAIRGRTLNSDATFARYSGDYDGAFQGYQASRAIWQDLGEHLRQGHVLLNEGSLHYHLQSYDRAEACLRSSLEIFQGQAARYPQALAAINLGLVERDRGCWEAALAQFAAAAAILEQEGAQDFLGRIANNIGEVEMLRGNFAAAATQFTRALALMSTRTYQVDVYLNLGLVYQADGDQSSALGSYQQALDLALELERYEIVALVRYRIGVVHLQGGQEEQAAENYRLAIEVIEQTRQPIRDEGIRISLMGRWQQIYEAMVLLCLRLGNQPAAFDYAERARARAFADLLLQANSPLEDRLAEPATADRVRAALPDRTLVLAYLAVGLRAPDSPLLDAIPASSPLRELLVTPAELWVFAVTQSSVQARRCPINPNALHGSGPLASDGRRFLQPAVLRRLYDALIAPVAALLAAADQAVIAPHGPLHHIPFAALLDQSGAPLLDQGVRLTNTPSATVLLHQLAAPPSTAANRCLALGYAGGDAHNLRHTESEAAAIAALCGGEVWRGEQGTAEQLRHAAIAYRWIHLACHGEFDTEDPLASWLLVGPEQRLRARDILADFRFDADLITLSACRSGVSRVLRGDEPLGLVRALLGAGARAVLVTLWPVEDTSARLLMECFYRRLLDQPANRNLSATLQAAQRELRTMAGAEVRDRLGGAQLVQSGLDPEAACPYAEPFFWAGYVLIGP
ncbi:MAG: CHAT domain-containing protein [Herpetosiphonaceae bacterium]|nr:CHAT domain-containing protein [Herpetosiphonaceae bacterium]